VLIHDGKVTDHYQSTKV